MHLYAVREDGCRCELLSDKNDEKIYKKIVIINTELGRGGLGLKIRLHQTPPVDVVNGD